MIAVSSRLFKLVLFSIKIIQDKRTFFKLDGMIEVWF